MSDGNCSMQRRIIFANRKGGSGKTSTSVNLAACLGARGSRVLLADLDPQGHATLISGLDPYAPEAARAAAEALEQGEPVRCIDAPGHGLYDVLPSFHFPGACLCDKLVGLRTAAFETATEGYDFVLLDTPPARDDVLRFAVTVGSEIVIPLPLQFLALEGFAQLMGLLAVLARQCNPELRFAGVIPVMTDPRLEHGSRIMLELRETLPDHLLLHRIRMDDIVADAAWRHVPVICLEPEGRAVRDFQALADQLAVSPEAASVSRRPWLCAELASALGMV